MPILLHDVSSPMPLSCLIFRTGRCRLRRSSAEEPPRTPEPRRISYHWHRRGCSAVTTLAVGEHGPENREVAARSSRSFLTSAAAAASVTLLPSIIRAIPARESSSAVSIFREHRRHRRRHNPRPAARGKRWGFIRRDCRTFGDDPLRSFAAMAICEGIDDRLVSRRHRIRYADAVIASHQRPCTTPAVSIGPRSSLSPRYRGTSMLHHSSSRNGAPRVDAS